MPFLARSIAAASAVPSLGTWLRLVAGSPLAIVMSVGLLRLENEKTLASRRGS
jgi:hypothetical protein